MPVSTPTLSPRLAEARALLLERFGYPDFRPGQTEAVSAVLEGRDTLVVLPTGGGKSLCYQVPALLLDGLTVVISPLISLMKDQVDALTARGLPATFINSTLPASEVSDRMARVQRGEIKLLYVAPERFDLGTTAERLKAVGVRLLAVDEAHCISEWGHDFRPSYLRVKEVRQRLGAPPTVALTATATPEVREDIVRQLGLNDPALVLTGFDRTNLSYHVIATKNDAAKDATLIDLLRERTDDGVAIVYASTRKTVERIATMLQHARVAAVAYHAGLDDAHRAEVQEAFMQERARVIVATNAFGMGIDKANVRLVVHHAMPGTLEAYYQEAGRAGRDRLPATAILLHSFPDRFMHEFFINGALPEPDVVTAVYDACVRLADRNGLVSDDAASIAAEARGKVSDREADSALRILARGGALAVADPSKSQAQVRLLATPARIKAELNETEHGLELALLRSLWKRAGERFQLGIVADLDALPPGLGGASGAASLLDALQDKQMVVWRRLGEGITLTDRTKGITDWPVDWSGLERRRRGELKKLEMVQKYAYTDQCRRAFVLRYFGDPAARPKCDGCDNCLGARIMASEGLAAVKGRRGAATRSAVSAKGGRGTSKATGAGSGAGSGATAGATDAPLSREEIELLDALKAVRSRLAKEDSVPAYVIFPDRSLREMARAHPRTSTDLARVHGVGPTRLERFGAAFLEVLRGD
ncbi:MAG: ATP-dependent DNA helicase [Gemmatimonadetes bacterium]|nr:ATP-dependent DNA helicase [Gemmatimonadota bacterium]